MGRDNGSWQRRSMDNLDEIYVALRMFIFEPFLMFYLLGGFVCDVTMNYGH